uniref:Uncharacterized protein n=1 Tax=Ciona intestinalis TaxID=7719 RepID=H2XUJ3_CIOIN
TRKKLLHQIETPYYSVNILRNQIGFEADF